MLVIAAPRGCKLLPRREDAAHSTMVASHALQELRSHSAFASACGVRKPRDRTQADLRMTGTRAAARCSYLAG
jgi:hypothetical protein